MSNKIKIFFIIIVPLLIAGCFSYLYWPHQDALVQESDISESLPNIPTPPGWYSWGENHYPDYETSTISNSITFANQPMNKNEDSSVTIIVVNMQTYQGETDEQWIGNVLSPTLNQLDSPTSTKLWEVINGRLVLKAVTETPAGGSDLNYYVFNNGVVYSFSLNPTHILGNILTSPDAQTLQTMVQNFTEALSK